MLKSLYMKKKQEGFSIVEVMIVLAIAGLIILVVFLAVPALQRNSRNTSKKSDVGSIGSLVSEYQGANNGKQPSAASFTASTGELTIGAASGVNQVKTTVSNSIAGVTLTSSSPTAPSGDNVVIAVGFKCNGTTVGGSSARSVALLYNLETAGGTAPQCTES